MPAYLFDKASLKEISEKAGSARKIALFLDFDGTLTPIRRDPEECFLSESLKTWLRFLKKSERICLSVISGRSLADIRRRVGIRDIYYAGNHGFIISGPAMRFTYPEALAAKPFISSAKKSLEEKIGRIEGAWVEDKKYTLSLHYRSVRREDIPRLKKVFFDTVGGFLDNGALKVIKGKKVLELVPAARWDKGKAVLSIMTHQTGGLPIFIGDDLTDESAFEALEKKGITIRVGGSKKTFARYYLKSQHEVLRFLAYAAGL